MRPSKILNMNHDNASEEQPAEPQTNQQAKLSLRNGVFETWELSDKSIATAITSAERTNVVRQRIWKGTKRCDQPISTNSRFGRYTHVFGLIGYERLHIKPLGRMDASGDRRVGGASMSMPDSLSIKEINRNKRSQSIPALLKKIVGEIELVGWLSPNDREQMINAFISDLAHRFNHTRDLISPKLSAAQNRRIIMKLFERIGRIKNSIIEKCHMRKVAMDELGIFAEEANSARVISTFRTELSRRINTSDLVEEILNELEGKEIVLEQTTIDNADALNQQVQEFKDALDSVIHPIPKLEPPQMSLKRQKTAMKQKMLQESANPEAKPAEDYEDDHKGSAFYKSKLENTVSAMRAMRTPGINTVRQEDAVANIGLIEDMAEIVARNASQLQAGSLVHVDDEVAAVEKTEDPLLQAHHSVSGPLASAKRQGLTVRLHSSVPSQEDTRYLPRSKLKLLPPGGFDFSVLDDTVCFFVQFHTESTSLVL
ncbi:hypothetical protein HDU83_000652 [Entophlyctis luteolus]|nr:hypothetical protein HDU83_000652 [Entophlyctis luteolus]